MNKQAVVCVRKKSEICVDFIFLFSFLQKLDEIQRSLDSQASDQVHMTTFFNLLVVLLFTVIAYECLSLSTLPETNASTGSGRKEEDIGNQGIGWLSQKKKICTLVSPSLTKPNDYLFKKKKYNR